MEKECAMGNGANNPDRGCFAKSFSKFDYSSRRRINLDRPFDANRGGGGGSGPTGSNCGGANEAQLLGDHISMQRRDEYIASSSSSPFHIFNSTGEMVAFTSAQWRELERQAMIYKYMISSMPVPHHLLYPPSPMNISLYNVGYTKNGVAVEPGRCKRTDGKKWRCSRDVAPHQKYCERHLHRGRPRSRKPVELNLNINNNNNNNNKINGDEKQKKPRLQQTKPFTASNSDLGSMMSESEMVPANEAGQKWLESNTGFNISPVLYHHQDSNRDLTYSDFPVGFIDSWSECNSLGNLVPIGDESFSPSLSLSIGGGSGFAGEMGNAQPCEGGVGFYGEDSGSPVCWGAFGGPLAEALCANPLVSSPSGVIQTALFSNSGGSSVCNSPSEVGFQRIK